MGSYLGTVPTSNAHHYGRGYDPIERATIERQPFTHAATTAHRVARHVARRATRPFGGAHHSVEQLAEAAAAGRGVIGLSVAGLWGKPVSSKCVHERRPTY